MATAPITTKQFIWFVLLTTVAFTSLVLMQGRHSALFGFPMMAATFVMMPATERNRPVSRAQLLGVLGGVATTAGFIWWVVAHRTAEDQEWERSLLDSMSRPIVVVPVWAFCVYLGYRRWRSCVSP